MPEPITMVSQALSAGRRAGSPSDWEELGLKFVSGACPQDDIRLLGVHGREWLSRLFEYDLLLTRSEPFSRSELDKLLHAPCAVALGSHAGDVLHGLLADITEIDTAQSKTPRYLARMVPTVWLLTMARTSRVYQNLSVTSLVGQILSRYQLSSPDDFRLEELQLGPEREYVVQYEETDWDFIQRWLEHEGRYYWFEHGTDAEVLVIADSPDIAPKIEAPVALSYRQRNELWTGGAATVWDFDRRQVRVPARVVVFDYNYRTPAVRLEAMHAVDEASGFGTVFHYNEHFETNDQGAAVAQLRAEHIQCERRTSQGHTDCGRLRVGHVFELQDHPDQERNGEYLVTSLEHEAGYGVRDERYAEDEAPLWHVHSQFTAIEAGVPFRPAKQTPRPNIHGIVAGHVASDGVGKYAEIDHQGRYKVAMTFDTADTQGSKVSRWIRMAQQYAGRGHGSSHPLRKGAEVLIAHIGGDPDRPIIVGSVPNAFTVSPTTDTNATQSVIETASGIRIEMEDRQQ